jgi:hypothetical protein
MAMRIGTVNGKPVKRVRKNSTGTTLVQPVKIIDGKVFNDGNQFEVKFSDFKKGKIN